jgi:hypothetical protein
MLATFIWNTLGRCCSSSAAVLPSFFAASYSICACCFSRICAVIRRSARRTFMPLTAALVDPGNTYFASMARRPSLR